MVLRIVLGVVYVGMALGQVLSWSAMPGILGAYRLLPVALLPWLAGLLIAGELVAGLWFLARPRSVALAPVWVYTAVALLWTVLGLAAYARGVEVANCGCFGRYLTQRLTWFTLAQDGLLLLYAGLMIRGGRRAAAARLGAARAGARVGAQN